MSERWSEPQEWPALAVDGVHAWTAHLPSLRPHLAGLAALLSPDEQERARRFRFEAHRERWQLTRGLLRFLLGRYLQRAPHELAFDFNAHGKPGLPGCALHFNTSHSGDWAAFAFTRIAAVGIDIEQVRGDLSRHEEIARRHFAPAECEQLFSAVQAERVRAFFDLWTCKEAFVKARGDGVFSGLNRFEVRLSDPRVVCVHGKPASDWWLARLPEIPGYSGAMVVNAGRGAPQFWKFTERWLERSR